MAVLRVCISLLLLQTCLLVRAVKVYTEEELYQSKLWRQDSSILAITRGRDGTIPDKFLSSLDQHIKQSSVSITQIKVTCGSEAVSHGVVCEALSTHQLVVRKKGDTVEGIEFSTEGELLSAVMMNLLGDSLSMLSSYAELKEYTKLHSHHFLVLTDNTTSADFIDLLVSLLNYDTPVAVVTNVVCLPLVRRPNYRSSTPTSSTLHLWSVTGEEWVKQPEDDTPDRRGVRNFLRRLQYPIIKTDYEDNQQVLPLLSFSDAKLHTVFAFPGLSGASDVDFDTLLSNIAQRTFMDYVYIKVDRSMHADLAQRLFVSDDKYYPVFMVLPYGDETKVITVEIEGQDTEEESDRGSGIMESIARDHSWTQEGHASNVPRSPSITDAQTLSTIMENNHYSMIVIFCNIEEPVCIDRSFPRLKSVMARTAGANVGVDVGGFIIECHSVKDLLRFRINSLPSYALFNATQNKWYTESGEVGSANDLIALVAKTTGISDLGDKVSQIPEPPPIPPPPLPPSLQEEDHFGLLFRTLPRVSLPKELILTNTNFDSTVTQHERTAVVFYMRWDVRSKVFLHHVMAAWERLDKSLNVVLGVVNCEDYTDVCSRYEITSFPSVLLFTPSTLHTPAPLTPSPTTLSSQRILHALGQSSTTDKETPLVELTPSTLPGALGGTLDTPLILWCDSQVTSDVSKVFSEVSEMEDFNGMTFAWMNSSKYGEILSGLLANGDVTYPTVVALKLNLRAVYHFPISDSFKEEVITFLNGIKDGSLQPIYKLPSRAWSPLQPPIPFPSKEFEEEDGVAMEDRGYSDDDFLFDAPPMDMQPPHPPSQQRPRNPTKHHQQQAHPHHEHTEL